MLKDFGSVAGITAFSEGVAEGLQEELSVQQKFSIDDAYTKANANLDRAHAYFAGFFGGLGLGGGMGGVTAVTNKARQFLNSAAENEFARQEAEARARVVADGGVVQESSGSIESQFDFAFNTKSGKDSVWVDLGSRTQFEKVQQKLFELYGEKIIAVPSFGRGALFTTNPLKAEQYQAFLDTNKADTEMHNLLLQNILGYSNTKNDAADGWVVSVRDTQTGNLVWYQQTDAEADENNVTGIMRAKQAAYAILGKANLGQKGRYRVDVQTREEHVEERLNAIPESEREVATFDEETQQPTTIKQNITEDPKDRDAFMDMDGLDGESEADATVADEEQAGKAVEDPVIEDIDRQKTATTEPLINQGIQQIYGIQLFDKDGNLNTLAQLKAFAKLIDRLGTVSKTFKETGEFETKRQTKRKTDYTDAQLEEGRKFLLQRKIVPV